MLFHWSLSDSKSPQVYRTLLSILAVFNNAVVWMVSTRPPTSKSARPFNNPLVIVPKAPITIGTIVTFIFDSFFNSLARSRYLSFFSHSFCGQPRQQSRQFYKFSIFFYFFIRSGLLAEIRWSVCMSKSHGSLCVSFFRTGAALCIYHLFVRHPKPIIFITCPKMRNHIKKGKVMMILILIIIINTQQNSPRRTDISYSNQNKLLATVKLEIVYIYIYRTKCCSVVK